MPDPVIKVRGLSKRYTLGAARPRGGRTLAETLTGLFRRPADGDAAGKKTFWALKDVSFDIARGEVVGIIGRNGAGKSTLLKILSRITDPTAGEIDITGRVGSLLEVGTGFHPELTGRENVYLNGAILGMRRAEIAKKFDEIVAFAEITDHLDTPVKHYSSGMYTRLAFAVAAHLEPEILIVDEVLAVGDADFQKKCLGKMEDVAGQGRTVLFVSHNMPMMLRMCRSLVLLDRGRVIGVGDAVTISRQYMDSGLAPGTGERAWPSPDEAPGDNVARLKAVRVTDAAGRPIETVDIRSPVNLEVDYWSLKDGGRPTVSINLFNEDGLLLFVTNDFNNPEWNATPRRRGVIRTRCTIPGNVLAEGRLFVLAAVCSYNPDVTHCLEANAVTFQVVDNTTGDGVRGDYSKAWPGVVRPMLPWVVHADPA